MANETIEYTDIILKHTTGLSAQFPTGCAWVNDNQGVIDKVEPWVQVSNRQLWVDSVCINPDIKAKAVTIDPNTPYVLPEIPNQAIFNRLYSFDTNTKKAELALVLNMDKLKDYLVNQYVTPFRISYGGYSYEIYNPFHQEYNAQTVMLYIGDNLKYVDLTHTLSSEFISNIQITDGTSLDGVPHVNTITINPNHMYMLITSTFGLNYIFDVTTLMNPHYGSTLILTGNTLDIAAVTRTNTGSTQTLVHEGTFDAVTSVTTDAYGRVTGVNTATFTMPSDSGAGGGTAITQELYASPLSSSQITGTNTEYRTVNLSISGDSTPVRLSADSTDAGGNGTDIRFTVLQDATTADTVTIKIRRVDGGIVQ